MIFSAHFSLIMAGYSACGILLGSYMIQYAGASELDLGFVFMIQPLIVFARPFICARADRYQSHKSLLVWCYCGNFLAYIPFIILPYLLEYPDLADALTIKLRFWILVICHVVGSFSFCGIRALGDALAVNYAKRVGSDYTSYRKFGAMSFGICGFGLGLINQNWVMPDFVPSHVLNVAAIFILMVLVYLWPDEYFVMRAQKSIYESDSKSLSSTSSLEDADKIPTGKELISRILNKLYNTIFFCCPKSSAEGHFNANIENNNKKVENKKSVAKTAAECTRSSPQFTNTDCNGEQKVGALSTWQQVRIFWLLIQRDIRIPLFLLLLLYGGLVGYAPPNFVFTYMNQYCHQKGICDGASLSGLVMISYCLCETICYMIINRLRKRMNYVILLQITLISLAIHYYFYGFLLPHLSPYFFLVESLHGLEYSSSLSACVELAFRFANEVEILIPELIRRKIISERDDKELVKVSLMATMNGCFTLVYDGFGTIIGSLIYGLAIDSYSFTVTWIIIGTLASIGVVAVMFVVLIGKCLAIEPQIHKIQALDSASNGTVGNSRAACSHQPTRSNPCQPMTKDSDSRSMNGKLNYLSPRLSCESV